MKIKGTKKMYVTVTGIKNYSGVRPFTIGALLLAVKEPENAYDSEAIAVYDRYCDKVGYIANSVNTKANGTMSAGRIYDKCGRIMMIAVRFATRSEAICEVIDKDCTRRETLLEYIDDEDGEEFLDELIDSGSTFRFSDIDIISDDDTNYPDDDSDIFKF